MPDIRNLPDIALHSTTRGLSRTTTDADVTELCHEADTDIRQCQCSLLARPHDAGEIGEGGPGAEVAAIGLSGTVYEPRTPSPQFEAQQLHAERKICQRAGDGVAVVASRGRPIIELAAAFAALVNTPPAKTHEVVNRPDSWHAINCVGAAYRADVSSGRNSHNTTSEVARRLMSCLLQVGGAQRADLQSEAVCRLRRPDNKRGTVIPSWPREY